MKHMPAHIHWQPIPQTYMSAAGTPDTYVDYRSDLWVEWKFLPGEDRLPATITERHLPTPKQREWLNRRYLAGRNALVVVGIKLKNRAHGILLDAPEQWSQPIERAVYEPKIIPASQIAQFIAGLVSRER